MSGGCAWRPSGAWRTASCSRTARGSRTSTPRRTPSACAQADLDLAAEATTHWAAGAPTVLGGDLNLRGAPTAFGYRHLAGHAVDHVLGRGLTVAERGRTLDRGALSDHAPVTVFVTSSIGR